MIKILIADDEYIERNLLEVAITECFKGDVQVKVAENGKQALSIANLWSCDIAVLDIEMPGLTGLEAARQIVANSPGTKIIFVTAYSLFEYAHEAVRLGASDYILKPVETIEVIKSVKKTIAQIEAQRQIEGIGSDVHLLEGSEGSDKANQIIKKVQKYLKQNYMMYDLSLDSVSEILQINSSYLSSLFKKCTGVNFIDYVADLKVNAAKELLKDPLRSAAEIAQMVGYESGSYFTRAFKKRTGMTPTEYRRTLQTGGSN